MTRRRAAIGGSATVALVVVALLVAVLADDDPTARVPDHAEVAHARGWQATCAALRTDADETTDRLRRRTGDPPLGATARRRFARSVVAPYLGRAERRLRRQAAAVPPPAWRAYHRGAAAALLRVAGRAADARRRVLRGDLAILRTLDPTAVGAGPPAPAELRSRTPACTP